MSLPDESDWYDPERAVQAEMGWILNGEHHQELSFVAPRLEKYGVGTVIEYGCGVGLLAASLPAGVRYVGIDKCPLFVSKAKLRLARHQGRVVYGGDVRSFPFPDELPWDLVMAWSFLKHFALEEWDAVLAVLLSHGKHAAFNVQILDRDLDDGTLFPHVYVTEDHLSRAVAEAGHKEVERQTFAESSFPGGGTLRSVALWTGRLDDAPCTA